MTLNEVLSNIFQKLYSYRLILFECYISNDNNTVTNSITVETLGDIARIRLNGNNFNVLESHFLKKAEDVEDMLRLIFKTNDLRVNSIAYIFMNEYQDIQLDAFSEDEDLKFSFYSIRDKDNSKFDYEVFSEKIDVAELLKDYQVFVDMLHKEKPKRTVLIIQDPIKDFRKKKLMDLGIN